MTVLEIPEDVYVSVNRVFFDLPVGLIKEDKHGRRRPERFPLVSHNGRHVICRDVAETKDGIYWEKLPVDKVVIKDFEYKIFLRKIRKTDPVVKVLSKALIALGYGKGETFQAQLTEGRATITRGEEVIGVYDFEKGTFVE